MMGLNPVKSDAQILDMIKDSAGTSFNGSNVIFELEGCTGIARLSAGGHEDEKKECDANGGQVCKYQRGSGRKKTLRWTAHPEVMEVKAIWVLPTGWADGLVLLPGIEDYEPFDTA